MLSKSQRLRAQEVREVLSLGRSVRGGHLSMKYLKSKEPLRSAAIVPKSLARKATARNTLRRAVYDSLPQPSPSRTGRALFFVRTIPKENIRAVFREDIASLLAKI